MQYWAEAEFPAKLAGLTWAPSPGCAQCLPRHSTRGPSLWFVTYRNKWPGIVSESPIAFRTLFSCNITQPPEAHEPWEASQQQILSGKGQPSTWGGEGDTGNIYQLQSRSSKELFSVPRYLSVSLLSPTLALEGENVPKIFGDWEGAVLKAPPPRGDDLCCWIAENPRRLLLLKQSLQSLQCASHWDTQRRCPNPPLEFCRS